MIYGLLQVIKLPQNEQECLSALQETGSLFLSSSHQFQPTKWTILAKIKLFSLKQTDPLERLLFFKREITIIVLNLMQDACHLEFTIFSPLMTIVMILGCCCCFIFLNVLCSLHIVFTWPTGLSPSLHCVLFNSIVISLHLSI